MVSSRIHGQLEHLCLVILNIIFIEFHFLLTVHIGIILVNNQLDAQFFFLIFYVSSLHVSSSTVLIIRRINCINTTSGMCHTV